MSENEYLSETHRAVIDDEGLLKVWPVKPRELRLTKSTPDGGLAVAFVNGQAPDSPEKKLFEAMNRFPLYVAGYAGSSKWHLDVDCGFQRWRGIKTSRQVSDALSKCGFDSEAKKTIMSLCRKHRVDYVPRYG